MSKNNLKLKSQNVRGGSYSTVLTAIVIIIILVVNIIVGVLPATITKLDYSESKLFTLSEQTTNLLGNLDEDVTVYFVAQSGREDESITELLDKYKAKSSGKIKIVRKDPAVNPNFTAEYTDESLPDNSLVLETNKRSRVVPYSDIYVTSYAQSSTSPTGYTETTSFQGEDALTSAIDYVTTDNLPKMYIVTGHGESSLDSSFQSAVLRENIELVQIALASVKSIPDDADCLYIQSPTSDINQDEANVLKEYIARGGNIFYVSIVNKGTTPNLDSILEEYGISIDKGYVCEGNSDYILQKQPYCISPMYGEHEIVAPLAAAGQTMAVYLGQNINVLENRKDTLKSTTLLKTTSTGYLKAEDSESAQKADGDKTGVMTLAIAVEDSVDKDTTSKLIVITTPMLTDSSMNTYTSGANYDFILNAVGYVCEHESMISIRGKNITSSSLIVSSGQMTFWIFILMILIPLVLIITGFIIWIRRRRR